MCMCVLLVVVRAGLDVNSAWLAVFTLRRRQSDLRAMRRLRKINTLFHTDNSLKVLPWGMCLITCDY